MPSARCRRGCSSSIEDVVNYIEPSTRQGQLFRLLHAIEGAEPGTARTDFVKPFVHFQNFQHRRGIVVVLSDFYEQPDTIVKTIEPLRYRGNEVILFHVLDPKEIKPKFRDPVCWWIWKTRPLRWKCRRNMRARNIKRKHRRPHHRLESKARSAGLDYFLMNTGRPLDEGLREYLAIRRRLL
jgi:uncharacterized protein (DUF58 family)